MLNVFHILGDTWAIETELAYLPFYKLNDRDIVLLDAGYAPTDREELTETLAACGFSVKGILCSHAHMDHVGNVRRFCGIYGCRVGAHLIEAAIAASPDSFYRHYGIHASVEGGGEECFDATDLIRPGQEELDFCGARFRVLHLPGHSDGHLGFVTPDGVAYLGDALMGFSQLAASKMPFTTQLGQDLASKRAICQLSAKAYVVAHKAIVTDIRELAEANISRLLEKVENIFGALRGTPTAGEWLVRFCEENGWNFRSERSFYILEFGFNSAVAYLEQTGRVRSRRVNGNLRFARKAADRAEKPL